MDAAQRLMLSNLSVTHLRALQTVVHTGSLSAAARELGYTTSAVSQQIAALEKSLRVDLFERGPRSLRPTPAGRRMNELAGGILNQIAEAADSMGAYSTAERGLLRIAATGSAAAQLLPRAVAGVTAELPGAEMSIVAPGTNEDVTQAVRSGQADAGIVYEYSDLGQVNTDGLQAHPLIREEMVIIGRDQGPSGMRASINDFAETAWICGAQGGTHDQLLYRLGEAAGFTPDVRHRTDDLDVIRGLVNQGLGVALVPVLSLGIDRNIRLYRLRWAPAHRSVLLVHRATDRNPLLDAALRAFTHACVDYLRWSRTAFEIEFETPMLSLTCSDT